MAANNMHVNLSLARFVKGADGHTPIVGPNGNWWIEGKDTGILARGEDGKSVYEIAVARGFEGTEDEFYVGLARLGSVAFFTQEEWGALSLQEQAIPMLAIIFEE